MSWFQKPYENFSSQPVPIFGQTNKLETMETQNIFKRKTRLIRMIINAAILLGPGSFFQANGQPIIEYHQSPVPNQYASFDLTIAEQIDKGIDVKWRIYKQHTKGNFLIERSFDGELYRTIGLIKGVIIFGKDEIFYTYLDRENLSGEKSIYYRIKHISDDNFELVSQPFQLSSEIAVMYH